MADFGYFMILVFVVQKSRLQAEACVIFLITFIKVLPTPLVANHLENIMRSLSAMVKDTKRYCRIQIGYLLKKLCKRFSAEELTKFVPGDDEVTHRRLKKIRKEMRRETRKQINEQKENKNDEDSDEEFIAGLEKKSVTIDDLLADSDSDLAENMDSDTEQTKTKNKKNRNTYIREDLEDIVDLADIKSIGNVLTNLPDISKNIENSNKKSKTKDPNRGFKTGEDGRLIISDKALRENDSDSDESNAREDENIKYNKTTKRGMEVDSSDDEVESVKQPKRKVTDTSTMRSGKTNISRYTAGGKGIHRNLEKSDNISMKSGKSSQSNKHSGNEYAMKKAKGDMKKKGKLEPYAYLPLNRTTLNKRKRAKMSGSFKNIVTGAKKGALKGVKNRIKKAYKT